MDGEGKYSSSNSMMENRDCPALFGGGGGTGIAVKRRCGWVRVMTLCKVVNDLTEQTI